MPRNHGNQQRQHQTQHVSRHTDGQVALSNSNNKQHSSSNKSSYIYNQPQNLNCDNANKLNQPQQTNQPNKSVCNTLNCITCDYIYEGSFFKLKNNFIIPLLTNRYCVSSNCTYVIKCALCGLFLIGQTGQLFRERMKQHLSAIKLFRHYLKPTTEVGYHFNLKGHSTKEQFQIAIFNSDIHDSKERLSIETDLIPSKIKIKETCFS
jgi:hypothetical protein